MIKLLTGRTWSVNLLKVHTSHFMVVRIRVEEGKFASDLEEGNTKEILNYSVSGDAQDE